jgi:hypothetical protein
VKIEQRAKEVITRALASNHLLPLESLKMDFCLSTMDNSEFMSSTQKLWYCSFTDTAADCLVQFVKNITTLRYFVIVLTEDKY